MKICVLGAGPSGLTTIKQLVDEGHDVTCFEKQGTIGGIWSRHDGDEDEMKVFDNLILTISMKLMAYSDFMPEGERTFCTHREYLRYLNSYADAFGLRKHIVLDTTVEEIRKIDEGQWRVTTSSPSGARLERTFEAIAICAGPFQTPNLDVTDLEKFTGDVVHSSRYRNNDRYRGKRVLVVGLAESGADIVREISDVACACTLSLRSYSFILPRLGGGGRQVTDSTTVRAHHYEMYVRATDVPYPMKALFGEDMFSRLMFSAWTKAYGVADLAWRLASRPFRKTHRGEGPSNGRNRLGEPMFPEKLDIATEETEEVSAAIGEWNLRSHNYDANWSQRVIFAKNASFIPSILNGKTQINDSGIARIDGRRVHFKDQTVAEFDAMVLCTGFRRKFSALGEDLAVEGNNVRNLYKHAFYPQHQGRVALIGFIRPFSGGIPICAEMQARYFAQLCSGKLTLPVDLDDAIMREKAWEETWTALSPRHTESCPSQALYLDALAKEIGCLMPISELIWKPDLLLRHWFYPFNQACYRLRGPHENYEKALKEMMSEMPGYWTGSKAMGLLLALSSMPPLIRPKYVSASRRVPAGALKARGRGEEAAVEDMGLGSGRAFAGSPQMRSAGGALPR